MFSSFKLEYFLKTVCGEEKRGEEAGVSTDGAVGRRRETGESIDWKKDRWIEGWLEESGKKAKRRSAEKRVEAQR